ncbi:B-cell receptor CD22-like [Misgurnus anguillicaudatus]|uniref:B-cell receptor CD22-like n=1 Tax=Misgurnus anguillicaudatus TaxID=75329 RepID=UPI003CCEFF9F
MLISTRFDMEMCFRISLMFLLMTAYVESQYLLEMNYSPSYVCALRGSTVTVHCALQYPLGYMVTWIKSIYIPGREPQNLCLGTNNRGKIQCHNQSTFSITLTQVTEADKHIYYCGLTTNCGYNCGFEYNVWTGVPGVQLDVTDLQVETNQKLKEGDSVTLTCKTTCRLTEETTFIWYRNTQIFTKGRITLNQLHLQSVSRDDSGVYRCDAVRGSVRLLSSPDVYLRVGDVDGQQGWGVNYSHSYVCALRGLTVRITCTLKYPSDHVVYKAFWTKAVVSDGELPDLCLDPEDRRGVLCHSENKDTHSITLTDVTEADKHIYYCRFITNKVGGKWIGVPGVQLDVTDLQVETNQRVKEGDSVTLTCKSTCRLTEETTFIWYRNTQIFTKGIKTVNQLRLQSVSRDDSGVYRCDAVRGSECLLSSPDVYLNVQYPPEKTSASISGSGEIMEGDSVNLTCSSESNPPVQIYNWYKVKETSSVGSGQTYTINNFNSSHSGWFYCEAQNEVGSQRSAAVSVTVTGLQGGLYTVYWIVAGCGGLFFITIFILLLIKKCRRDCTAEDIKQKQTADSSDDTYTALNPESRTSDDIYKTIRSDQYRAANGVYTTLELQSRSSEYDTLTVNTH